MWTWIKKNVEKHPFWCGIAGVILVPVFVTGLATWSIFIIEGLFNFFVGDVAKWLGIKSGYRVSILIGLGSVLGIAALAWRNYALQRQAKAAFEQAEATSQQAKATFEQAKAANKQAETASKTQVSDQLTKAMDLLARVDSEGNPLKEARVGGLYSLESLANNEPVAYGAQVMKTIVAYTRENARKTAGDMPEKTGNRYTDEQRAKPLGEDVKAAFAVLKKLYDDHANTLEKRKKIGLTRFFDDGDYARRLKLGGSRKPVRDDLDFSRANFQELDFRNVDWIDRPCCDRTNFQNANLWNANFAGAHLEGVLLQGAYALSINMRGASLWGAQLQDSNIRKADVRDANLEHVDTQGAQRGD